MVDKGLKRRTLYFYKVCAAAEHRVGPESITVRTQPPIVEEAVVSVLSTRQVELVWKAPKGEDIDGYYIERASVEVWSEDQLRRLKSRLRPLPEPSVGAIRRIGQFAGLTPAPVKETVFVDPVELRVPQKVEGTPTWENRLSSEHVDPDGKPYRFAVFAYRIRAVNALGVESGPSPYFLTIPSSPEWVFSKQDGTTCHLKWTRNPEKNLEGYRVYRLDGRWDSNTISRLTGDPVNEPSFADDAAGNETRRYHIVAVDALGQEGLPSAPVWFDREWKRFYEDFTTEWHQ